MRRSAGRTLATVPMITAAANGLAAVALATILAPGTSLSAGPDHVAYVASHLALWRVGWALWIAAALTLLAFFGWWAARVGWSTTTRIAVVIGALGVIADVSAELRLIAWPVDLDVGAALRQSGVVANACYSVAGSLLMLATPRWPGSIALWGWAVWILGFGLSVAAAASSDEWSRILTAAIFVLFLPWLVIAGRWLS